MLCSFQDWANLLCNAYPCYIHKCVTGVKLEFHSWRQISIGLGLVQILGQEGWSFSRQVGLTMRQNIVTEEWPAVRPRRHTLRLTFGDKDSHFRRCYDFETNGIYVICISYWSFRHTYLVESGGTHKYNCIFTHRFHSGHTICIIAGSLFVWTEKKIIID